MKHAAHTNEEQYHQAFLQVAKWEEEVRAHNNTLLNKLGTAAMRDYETLMDGCCHQDWSKIECIDAAPSYIDSLDMLWNADELHYFTMVRVRQHATGTEGDSWEGYYYCQCPDGKWLKIFFEC